MEAFQDFNGAHITLSFQKNSFGCEPDHILVICRHFGNWLLTDHKKRGWEFPGGKRETGETLEQAAVREVLEETGGRLKSLCFIGEYKVENPDVSFIKRIYFGEVSDIKEQNGYFETNGPVLVKGNLLKERFKEHYSFIMKDEMIRLSLQRLKEAGIC